MSPPNQLLTPPPARRISLGMQPPQRNPAEPALAAPPLLAAPRRMLPGLALLAGAAWLVVAEAGRSSQAHPVSYGVVAVLLLYALSVWVTGRLSPFQAAMGADGRLSTSRFQFLLWTAVVVFSYSWLYAARAHEGAWQAIGDIPANVLLAMGISVGTLAAAKGITSSYLLNGLIDKPAQPPENASAADLVRNDNDAPDLTKIQMLVWTFVAAAVYLAQVAFTWTEYAECTAGVLPGECRFPDIDPALMVLMGLGQGAYLGNKLVTVSTPRIGTSTPPSGGWGTLVTLKGQAFGASADGQWVTLDDRPVPVETWSDTEVAVRIPRRHPDDREWSPGQTVQLGLVVNGRRGAGTAPFQVAPPRVDAIAPESGPPGTRVTLRGAAFGKEAADSRILLNDAPVDADWTDTAVTFVVPATLPKGAVRVGIRIYGQSLPTGKTFTVA